MAKFWTVGVRFFSISAIGIAMVGVIGAAGYVGLRSVNSKVGKMAEASSALRHQVEGDMMHDALRADVFASLLAKDAKDTDAVRDDVKSHAERFRELIAKNEAIQLSTATSQAIADIKPTLDHYIRSAEQQVEIALNDRDEAEAEMPA